MKCAASPTKDIMMKAQQQLENASRDPGHSRLAAPRHPNANTK